MEEDSNNVNLGMPLRYILLLASKKIDYKYMC